MNTLVEMLAYGDWAWAKLVKILTPLSPDALDRPFHIGPGTIRKTLYHLWAAEQAWLRRMAPREQVWSFECSGETVAEIDARFQQTAAERNALLPALDTVRLEEAIAYRSLRGEPFQTRVREILLHVCNHGAHHRAQLLNMLRHVGVTPPWLDYLAFLSETPRPAPPDAEPVRVFRRYARWAQTAIFERAAALPPAALDQPLGIGLGTLRATLLHIRFAEQWWWQNMQQGPERPFPELPPDTPLAELARLDAETAAGWEAALRGVSAADLSGPVSAHPSPGAVKSFSLGAVQLQLCFHGTHHRAQALNMLRQLNAPATPLDLIVWTRTPDYLAMG